MVQLKFVGSRVKRELARIPQPDRDRIAAALRSPADAPRSYGIKQLSPGIYRQWRQLFEEPAEYGVESSFPRER